MDPTHASELVASAQELLLELDAEEWCTPYGLGGGEECIKALQKSIEAITGKPWRTIIREVRKSPRYQALQNRKLLRRNKEARRMEEARLAEIAELREKRRQLNPHRPRPVRETDEWLWESATEFCAALDHDAGRTMEIKRAFAPAARRPRAKGGTHPNLKLV